MNCCFAWSVDSFKGPQKWESIIRNNKWYQVIYFVYTQGLIWPFKIFTNVQWIWDFYYFLTTNFKSRFLPKMKAKFEEFVTRWKQNWRTLYPEVLCYLVQRKSWSRSNPVYAAKSNKTPKRTKIFSFKGPQINCCYALSVDSFKGPQKWVIFSDLHIWVYFCVMRVIHNPISHKNQLRHIPQ